MKVIVGLGNIGPEYATTRHNVGFMVVDRLAADHGGGLTQRHRQQRELAAIYGDIRIGSEQVRLVQPQTMMNRSGLALGALASWHVEPADLLLVCDDVNLPLGILRMKPRGSAGGHHGLMSCFAALGTSDVPRLRVGVGTEPLPRDLTDFVVSPFRPAERPLVAQTIERATEACELWAAKGIEAAMNRANPARTDGEGRETGR